MRCSSCAADNADAAKKCAGCGARLPRARSGPAAELEYWKAANARAGQNPPAMASYRCAMYGLIPLAGLFFGAAALVLGLVGYWRAKRDPESKGFGHAGTGIVLGGLEFTTNLAGVILIWIGITSLQQ